MVRQMACALSLLTLAACATQQPAPPYMDTVNLFIGKSLTPAQLEEAATRAAAHPLGSRQNPVRADMPEGENAYLARLRCANGAAPRFTRDGNFGHGVFGSIIDRYSVACDGGDPAPTKVFIDMYHPGYIEPEPVPGFSIMP